MECQRHLFPLRDDEAYLNGASRSPQLRTGAAAARQALQWREDHSGMPIEGFFAPVEQLKASFAQLINSPEPGRVALIPAASYGIATVAKNLPLSRGEHILVVQDQFPSNYYAWHRLCADAGAELITVARPTGSTSDSWSDRVLAAIGPETAAVAIAHVHWADGTVFDLEAIRRRTDEVGAWLVIDGTQSIGALPFDVARIRPDALIAGGYKWLLGPYGTGYAWYGPRMDDGVPLEENWINRADSHDFGRLANYRHAYRPLAARYSVGEHSNFISIPMQQAALDQLNSWTPQGVQAYTARLWEPVVAELAALGIHLPDRRAHHLVGVRLPARIAMGRLQHACEARRISLSYRGDAVRISPNVYNRPAELEQVVEVLRDCYQ
ncbi:Isopenicillin N epimerase [Neolewinella maritima]|uniref:Isopenicillin N epimerase n=1 Tax=Neolewinella maritima TaxID=1383882 RepID=A0ABM9B4J4_9BACT|nr:aminotransferase class V-fold PLP-dependent enzyme [Neolewinella maritima]CAH1002253.1 Isopenicillin N epimerase [Neolewinella maritima]